MRIHWGRILGVSVALGFVLGVVHLGFRIDAMERERRERDLDHDGRPDIADVMIDGDLIRVASDLLPCQVEPFGDYDVKYCTAAMVFCDGWVIKSLPNDDARARRGMFSFQVPDEIEGVVSFNVYNPYCRNIEQNPYCWANLEEVADDALVFEHHHPWWPTEYALQVEMRSEIPDDNLQQLGY